MTKCQKILKPNLLPCEGADAQYFLIVMIQVLVKENSIFENMQVLNFAGIDELSLYLNALKNMENFETVKSIIVIRDAEKDGEASKQARLMPLIGRVKFCSQWRK